ncbi:Ig-like domain-containing protein [Pseudomonas sp. McL0111]|uniref:Ig-like domain-containing protein n=1 Tax=Pseudomonas sp. McL0111 TaxID=3457357 RepID=UPI00403E745B
MINETVKVAITDGNTVTDVTELSTSGQPVRIKAIANGKYILAEGDKGFAPQNITVKRVGKDLHVSVEGGDPDQPQLIIEGFYDSQGQLVGMAEDGSFHEYIAADAVQDHNAAFLIEGVPAPQVLGVETVSGMSGMNGVSGLSGGVFGTGLSMLSAGLIGLAAVGLAGAAVAASNSDDDKKDDSAPTPPAPVVSVSGDNVGTDTGPLVNGGTTDDTTPTFSGEGTPGNTIIIKDGDKVIGETIIGEDGKWTFTPEPLGDGPHDIVFVERNRDGIEGPPSPGFEIIIDTQAPAQTVISSVQDDGSTPEAIVQNGKTNDSTPTLNGQAEPGSTVEIFANGEKIGTAPVGADGTWSFTPSALQDNTYSFTVVAVDAASNRGLPSEPFVLTIYTVVPPTPGQDGNAGIGQVINDDGDEIPAGSSTNDSTPTFTGSGQEPGTTVTLRDENGAVIGEAIVDADGNWSVTPDAPLSEENHEIVMTITDPLGNVSLPSDPFVVVVDTTPPGIPGQDGNGGIDSVRNDAGDLIAADGSTNDTTPTITGSNQQPGDKVTIYNGTDVIGTAIVAGDGTWSITPTMALGENTYSFTMSVTDQANNESAQSLPYVVIIDTTAPGTPGDGSNPAIGQVVNDDGDPIADGGATNDTTPTFSGSGQTPGETVTLYDGIEVIGSVVVADDGSWTITPDTPLSNADHDVTMTVTDPAGNESAKSDPFVITVDTIVPAAQATIVSMDKDSGTAGDFVTNDGTAGRTISGTLTAALTADERVQVSLDGGTTWEDAIDDGAGGWTFVDNNAHATSWEIQARVVDAAGNLGAITTQQVTLDTTVESPTDISWDGTTIHVGFAPAGLVVGDVIQLTVDGIVTDHTLTAAEISAGGVDLPFTGAINNAPDDIRVALVDGAGNVSDHQVLSKDVTPTFSEDFNGQSDIRFAQGSVHTLTGFTVTATHIADPLGFWNTGFGNQTGSGNRPTTRALELGTAGSTLRLDITNPEPVNTVKMTVGDLGNTEVFTATFYDAGGNVVFQQVLTAASGGLTQNIVLELPYGQEFSAVELKLADGPGGGTYVWIDNIEFGHYDYVESVDTSFAAADVAITAADTYLLTSDDDVFSVADVALLDDSNSQVIGTDGHDTLMLTGTDQVLDLTNIAGKLESIEVIDISGTGNNTLNLSLGDVLEQGQTSLFTGDDTVQMMVKGNVGDVVNLDDLLSDSSDPGNWANQGTATVGGVTYDVFSHSTVDAELLVQQGVTTNLV